MAFESGADTQFDYLVPESVGPIPIGQRVKVPFGRKNKIQIGFCVEVDVKYEESFGGRGRGGRLKKVSSVVDDKPLLDQELMAKTGLYRTLYDLQQGEV